MVIGIPKEVKNNEYRVAATPYYVAKLVENGHKVLIEKNAGLGSGYLDKEYETVGAEILDNPKIIFEQSEMIIKIKEPQKQEYDYIKEGQIIFTYFHFSSSNELLQAMLEKKAICIAYETVTDDKGMLPLLIPMSEIAGRMSVQQGAYFLNKSNGGKGVLLGGIPGERRGNVTVIGAGIVGQNAALMAAGMLANVDLLDINTSNLRALNPILPKNIQTLFASEENIMHSIQKADLIIGAVLIPGSSAPKIIQKKHLSLLQKGTVLVDVAIDQGGCFETSKPTTHQNPVFEVDGIVHYCVANMPGAVPQTATNALTNATLQYALQIANKGWEKACLDNKHLNNGVNVAFGKIYLNSLKNQL
jgi:alanine dehydrogenase